MTPLHEQLRDLADLSQDPRRLLIEAADRLELVEGLYEDQVEITRNWKLAADARWDRIKRLEEAGDELSKWVDRNTPVTIRNDWTTAKEAKP